MSKASAARKTVVVIGGGYGGISVAKALDDVAGVVLVEPKDAFVHNVAALRALVDPSWLPRIYLPYDGLLATAAGSSRTAPQRSTPAGWRSPRARRSPRITSCSRPGRAYPFPAKSDVDATAAAHRKVRTAHAAIAAARRVLLLGAGPVGVELAGEIKAIWPDKHVTLLDVADDVLGARFRPELKAELRRQLRRHRGRAAAVQRASGKPADPAR